MSTLPLLSIAIPTHNRSQYAIHSIRCILRLDDERIELVVSDTSTDNKLSQLLRHESTPTKVRFKYILPSVRLDMTGNHNFALGACTGEYVCLIGDDDTVSFDAVVAAEWAKKNNVEIIAPNVVANYVWPDFRSRFFGEGHSSRLYISKRMGSSKFVNSETALNHALKNAGQGTDGLPKIYHGIVQKSLMEKIRSISGNYFHGSSPDVSGAIGLALVSTNFLAVDYPLTIPGASGGSNTGRSALNSHKGKLSDEPQTNAFERTGWSLGVPKFFSVETVWAHAALESLGKIDQTKLQQFNFAKLIGICLILHKEYINEITVATLEAETLLGINSQNFQRKIRSEQRAFVLSRTSHYIRRVLRPTAAGGKNYVGGLDNISLVPDALSSHLSKNGISWENLANSIHYHNKA